ncbi:MAG: hypothetical protein RL417_2218 [Pseudomonadota bacterium]|jgi:outer membrane murein-binding lipoprotein Lpp
MAPRPLITSFIPSALIPAAVLVLGVSILSGCIHKPEGPAERIGRSIDEISSAIDDMGRDDDAQRDRIRRERERRDREAALRRERFDRDDDRFDDPYRDRGEPLPPLPEDEFGSVDDADTSPLEEPYGADGGYDRERY